MSARGGGFDQLLNRLSYGPGDRVPICHIVGGRFGVTWTTAADAPEVADKYAASSDVWFGVNAMASNTVGRGTVTDVERLAGLYADLDLKPGGMPSAEAAVAVISELSAMLGTKPVAIVQSGHGFQPYWGIDPDDPAAKITNDNRGDAVALLRRFGRLIAHVAEAYGGRVDPVFDLARVLRVPGTFNRKAAPVKVTMAAAAGRPLTIAEVDEALITYNAVEQHGDRDLLAAEVTAPVGDWAWAERTNPAVTRAGASWVQRTPPARHPWLLGVATSLAYARRLGWVTEADHTTIVAAVTERFGWLLKHHGKPRDPAPGEVADCFTHGTRVAERKTVDDAHADWAFWVELTAKEHPVTVLDPATADAFWSARPILTHIHTYAQARMCSPWAVLGVVLTRVVVATPPKVVLPALVGSVASLNLYVAAVGPSGGGKGASEAAATDAVNVGNLDVATVGSGEGIGHLFAHREKGEVVRDRSAVLFTVAEVDNLTALGNRQGATLLPQLRMAWSGERLGFSYVDRAKTLPIERGTYRLGLVLGVQPGRARPLLEDTDAGTPQRFLWLPTTDPHAPEVPPESPQPWAWNTPGPWPSNTHRMFVLDVPEVARNTIIANRRARLRGQGDALDGHALLARLKVAAALALLDGRQGIGDQDWELAGTVMDVSDHTRAGVVAYLDAQGADKNRARGEAEGARAVTVAEKLDAHQGQRVARTVMRALRKRGDWATRRDVKAGVTSTDRPRVGDALVALIDAGQVEVRDDTGKPYYRATGAG